MSATTASLQASLRRVSTGVRTRAATGALAVVLTLCSGLGWMHAQAGALAGLRVQSEGLGTLPEVERRLLLALNAITEARLDTAERYLETVIAEEPNYRLARLVYADVLMAKSGRAVNFHAGRSASRVRALFAEARARIAHARRVPAPDRRFPDALLMVAADTPRVVVVDIEAARLYLYANEARGLRLLRSIYVSTAKNGAGKRREGDQRTPVGVYFVTSEITRDALPDFYGPGALPVNYPNEWDLRRGHTGYGIWLHGVPSDTFARPPRASDGCVAVSNSYMSELLTLPHVNGTPVVIADRLQWVTREELASRRARLLQRLSRWKEDWESRDVARYARHYSGGFSSGGTDRSAWLAHKQRVNVAKEFIQIRINNVSAFAYPGESDMMVVDFDQDYRSSNYNGRSAKRQYWKREADGEWRIIHEAEPKLLPVHLRGMPYSARARLSAR